MKVGSVQQSHSGPVVGYQYRLSTSGALSKNELFRALVEKELEESVEMFADQTTGQLSLPFFMFTDPGPSSGYPKSAGVRVGRL
ncbi:hypothetical protein D3C84_866540 [compost metagenome]